MRAVVVGGGLAGIAAALELVRAAHDVTLLEARPTLGGAVQTLPRRDGDPEPPPDNGQHVALGCFTAYLELMREIGSGDAFLRERLALPVIDERGRVSPIGSGALGLLRYRHLTLRERLSVARAVTRIARLDPRELDGRTFGSLLRDLGQTRRTIERFWDVFVRPALNLRTDEASAALGAFTVKTGLLGPRGSSDLLVPARPLGEMHGAAATGTLAARGAAVRTRARVAALKSGAAVLEDGERVEGQAFVVALPPREGAELLGEPEPPLEDSPIVSVHLLFDRPLLRSPLAALLGSPAHWVFDRGRLTGHEPERGQYLTVVSSGAPELLEPRGRELVETIAEALTARLGPAELLWSRVSREPRATFAGRPGTAAHRPGPRTALPNVARAGAWTEPEWPATMEAAVRSGRAAARLFASAATMVAA